MSARCTCGARREVDKAQDRFRIGRTRGPGLCASCQLLWCTRNRHKPACVKREGTR
jgi:hypothetical protein